MTDVTNMEDIAVLRAEIDSKLEREAANLSSLKDTLAKSNTNTENMLGILSTFESRLRKLEQTIVPVYNETENLRRRQENIEKTMTTLDHVLGYYHISQEAEMMIKDGPEMHGLDRYLQQMDKLMEALVYFKQHNQNTIELREVAALFEQGKDCLQAQFHTLLARHGRPVPAVVILDQISADEELPGDTELPLEHLPEKVIEDLSEISRWLVSNGNGNVTDFLKDYITMRSSILIKSLQGLKEHLKSSSGTSATLVAPHSPALSGKFRGTKDTPGRKSKKFKHFYTRKASTALLKSPFDQGKRQSAMAEVSKEDTCEVDIDIYIMELTALLKLMQSELQLLGGIIPEKYQRSVYDNIVQPGLETVVNEGETLASYARRNIGKHEFMTVLSIFPVVKHLRSIKPDFDLTLEGCQAPTKAKLASLLSTLGSTGAKALEEFIANIKNDPDKASNMPRDGTVHELTNHTIVFLEQLKDYSETAGAMLLMHGSEHNQGFQIVYERHVYIDGEQAAPSEAVDDRKSKLKLADYCTKVLSALGLNLSNKSETYGDQFLRPIFMLNNYNYILKSLKRTKLIDLIHLWNKDVESYYDDQIHEQKRLYSQSWSRVMHYIMELDAPVFTSRTQNPDAKLKDKDRQNIKDKFTGFNKELEEISRQQKGYAIPDFELRAAMKRDNVEYIVPAYRMFLDKYKKLSFTKNPEKYIKHTVEDVEARINNEFFDTAA